MSKSSERNPYNGQFALDFESEQKPYLQWPDQDDFPINLDYPERTVEKIVLADLARAKQFTILTGYTSLSHLIDLFGKTDEYTYGKSIRIVLGFNPNSKGRKRYHSKPLDKEIAEFWLKEGLSILQGGSVINLIAKIEAGQIQFKFYNKLHSKIYVSDSTAMIGSSNFSKNGLVDQTEANSRYTIDDNYEKYSGAKSLADNCFIKANPYPHIVELLKNLVSQVDWKDALSRAIAEILEGGWLSEYENLMSKLETVKLWPTQWRGLAQAMTILQENSNVLIADPTGAGKTKLGSTIILALESWLFESGRKEKANSVMVCPPLVTEKWKQEFQELSTVLNNQISNGTLSQGGLKKLRSAERDLELANILAIDEAHNYLNINSKRSIAIRRNNADFKILITATPINKKIDDLLKIIELLDVDNLDDESFESFKKLKLRPDLKKPKDIEKLKQFVSRFTVRRTKKIINEQIALEPDKYMNALDELCRFPTQREKTYKTLETEADQEIVKQINKICKEQLKGLTYLRRTNKPKFDLKENELQSYIDRRFNSSKALSIFVIRHRLRSSRVAILEHIIGKKKVLEWEDFEIKKTNENKIKIDEIDKLIESNKLPYIHKDFKNCTLPDWMTDLKKYKEVCLEEKANYLKIAELVKRLSPKREEGKAKELLRQIETKEKILAFDGCVITLHYLKHLIKKINPLRKVLVATGSTEKQSNEVLEKFNLTSKNTEKIIALCSDMMSEGVDLQKASAVTLLDLPSVIRIVEQRFGRIDRMDSQFKEIEMYWPDETEEFSLSGDRRLFELTDLVSDALGGSNFKIPDNIKFKHFSGSRNIQETIAEFKAYELADDSWEGIQDNFLPIIELKQGKKGLITEEEYEAYRGVDTSVKAGVSFIKSKKKWCFIAVRGDKNHSPKWYFIDPDSSVQIYTEFPEICRLLREHLDGKSEKVKWDDNYLKYYLDILQKKEVELLPPKKRRALKVAHSILNRRYKQRSVQFEEKKVLRKLLELLNKEGTFVDLDDFATTWIKFLQPYLENKRLRNSRNRKAFNLNDLVSRAEVSRIHFNISELQRILENVPLYEKIDYKIASCIVGVPASAN